MTNNKKLILLLAIVALAWSCNEQSKKVGNTEERIAKTEKAQKNKAEDMLLENLRNTTQVNVDDFEAWFPKNLGGLSLERTKSMAVFQDLSQMAGWYKRVGDKMITLNITDAAGPSGDIIANKINVLGKEPESDVENMQLRSVNVKGRLARQSYVTDKNFTTIMFFYKERFMIHIAAHDYNVEDTWKLVDELDFNTLDRLIK